LSHTTGAISLDQWWAYTDFRALKEVLPNSAAALRDLADLVRFGKECMKKEDEDDPNVFGLDADLTGEEENRQRYRYEIPRKFAKFGPRWGRGLGLAWDLLPNAFKPKVNAIFREIHLYDVQTESCLQKLVKTMTDIAKKHGKLIFPGEHEGVLLWKMLINFEGCGGYRSPVQIETFLKDTTQWVQGNILHEMPNPETGRLDEEYFLKHLRVGMREFYDQGPNIQSANRKAKSLAEWAKYPGNWGSSGATSNKKKVYYKNKKGKWVPARGNKWRTAMAMSYEEVMDILTADDEFRVVQLAKAIQKLETGKVRAVINSDLETFLRMAYVSTWLEVALKGHPRTTLFYSVEQMVKLWERMGHDCADPDTIKIPLDQSHFDWQQNMNMIEAFCDVTKEFISDNCNSIEARVDMLKMMDIIKLNLTNPRNKIILGDEEIYVKGGVLSGWRWTALIDTVFNYGEMHCALRLLADQGLRHVLIDLVAQGDDDKVLVAGAGQAAALVEAYRVMNFEVNPSKFFVDNERDEYLRQVGGPTRVNGYMVRAVNSLLWRNPIAMDPPEGILRAKEQIKQWNLAIGRDADIDVALKYMKQDIMRGNSLSEYEYEALLRTPNTFGGLGFYRPDIRYDWLEFKPGQVKIDAEVDNSFVKGLDREIIQWKNHGVEIGKGDAVKFISSNLKMSDASKEIIPGELKRVERLYTIMKRDYVFVEGYRAYFRRPRWNDDLPVTMQEYVLGTKIQEKDWKYINDVMIDISCYNFSVQLKRAAGNSVWIDWLLGKLPFHPPVVMGWSDLKPTYIYNNIMDQVWDDINRYNRFNYKTVKRAALTAELTTRELVGRSVMRLGG